jgi:hypothetical protein
VCFLAVDFFAVECLTVDFLALTLERFADALFDLTAFDLADFDLADFDFTDFECDFTAVQRTLLRLLRELRARVAFVQRTAFGVVQPTSASARNALGIASTGVGPSSTASTAASERSERTSAMIFAGRCALAA